MNFACKIHFLCSGAHSIKARLCHCCTLCFLRDGTPPSQRAPTPECAPFVRVIVFKTLLRFLNLQCKFSFVLRAHSIKAWLCYFPTLYFLRDVAPRSQSAPTPEHTLLQLSCATVIPCAFYVMAHRPRRGRMLPRLKSR